MTDQEELVQALADKVLELQARLETLEHWHHAASPHLIREKQAASLRTLFPWLDNR